MLKKMHIFFSPKRCGWPLAALFLTAILRGGLAQSPDTLTIDGYLAAKQLTATVTKEGVALVIDKEGTGEQPRTGDYVQLRYVGKLLTGKVFDESPAEEPFVFQLGYRQVIQGWDIAFAQLKVGTRARVFIPSNLAYGSGGIENIIPANAPLLFEVEVVSILTVEAYDAYMRALEEKERLAFDKKVAEQFETDKKAINDYAITKKWKVQRTPSGLSYIITKPGKGSNAKAGNTLTVHYEGMLLNDKVFDSSKGRAPFTFVLGEGKAIAGWEEGLTHFNKGSEGYLLIPSKYAYGATPLDDGKVQVPAFSVLIFKIQVVDIK